jgi:hypothetical protein
MAPAMLMTDLLLLVEAQCIAMKNICPSLQKQATKTSFCWLVLWVRVGETVSSWSPTDRAFYDSDHAFCRMPLQDSSPFHGVCGGGVCVEAPSCGAGSVATARTGHAPCISDLSSEGDTNGVCVADTIEGGRTWYHCVQCASPGCGRQCFDDYDTGFVSRGDVMPCSSLAHLCNTTSARASLGSIDPDPTTITAVRGACRATCGLCTANPSVDTVELLDPVAQPDILLMNNPTPPTLPATAVPTTVGGERIL